VQSEFNSGLRIVGKLKFRVFRKLENQKTRKPEPEPENLQAEISRGDVGQIYLSVWNSVCRSEFALPSPTCSNPSVSVLMNFNF